MLELIDTAHPLLTLTMVIVMLVALWLISALNQKLRIAESRLDSLEREQRQVDDQLDVLSHAGHSTAPPAPADQSIGSVLGHHASMESGEQPARPAPTA